MQGGATARNRSFGRIATPPPDRAAERALIADFGGKTERDAVVSLGYGT